MLEIPMTCFQMLPVNIAIVQTKSVLTPIAQSGKHRLPETTVILLASGRHISGRLSLET